jgi:hypothetical protein
VLVNEEWVTRSGALVHRVTLADGSVHEASYVRVGPVGEFGYQPTSSLDVSNPPSGGSGVPRR